MQYINLKLVLSKATLYVHVCYISVKTKPGVLSQEKASAHKEQIVQAKSPFSLKNKSVRIKSSVNHQEIDQINVPNKNDVDNAAS